MGKATNKLAVWGQTGDYDGSSEYSITSGETQGFQSGSLVIAQTVNKALRNASIFEYALAETLASYTSEAITNFDISPNVSDISTFSANVKTAIDAYIAHIKVSGASSADAATNVTTNINGKAISSIFETNGTTAKNATNVTTKINGKNISSIFETNGTTVKNATDAANVSETINDKNITDIFETNGTTVKEATHATKATQDESGNNIKATYAVDLQLKANSTDTLQLLNKNGTQIGSDIKISKVDDAAHADNATNATNVTTNINGKAISSIFESNGTTVKDATNATNANTAYYANTSGVTDAIHFKQTDINKTIPREDQNWVKLFGNVDLTWFNDHNNYILISDDQGYGLLYQIAYWNRKARIRLPLNSLDTLSLERRDDPDNTGKYALYAAFHKPSSSASDYSDYTLEYYITTKDISEN